MSKILLFGKRGQLGWELNQTLAPLGELFAFDSSELDLTDLAQLRQAIRRVAPQFIVNAAAYTDVDRAETEVDLAQKINANAPRVMAEEARELNAAFVHYSTDYVFDGKKNSAYAETDATNPLNAYGQSKLDGEQAVAQVGGAALVLRTSWVYSLRGNGFVPKVLAWARTQKTLRVVADQIGSPTWARALAEIVAPLLQRDGGYLRERAGLYHLGGLGGVSRFDFAREILRLDPRADEQIIERLEPALTAEFPTPAQRPLHSALDCSRFEETFNLQLPAWQDALRQALGA
ncbi:MAG: dTDP-4-dehydrorhamnose reductase [Anaerolineales bacterium]|nr:dTDP-4-dehydrorhamnose reductase [Anaerolineales bacterium]